MSNLTALVSMGLTVKFRLCGVGLHRHLESSNINKTRYCVVLIWWALRYFSGIGTPCNTSACVFKIKESKMLYLY